VLGLRDELAEAQELAGGRDMDVDLIAEKAPHFACSRSGLEVRVGKERVARDIVL